MKRPSFVGVLFLAALMPGLLAADWPQFRRDNSNSAKTAETLQPPLTVKWRFKVEDKIVSSPTVQNDVVYFGSRDRGLYALKAETGEQLWKFTALNWVDSSPAVTEDAVYFTSRDGNLYCLNPATGQQRWTYQTGGTDSSSPAVAGGLVFAGSGFPNKFFYSVEAATGKERWRTATEQMVYSSPVVTDEFVIFGCNDNHIYALKRSTGELVWTFQARGGIYYASPSAQGGRLFVASGDFDWSVYCLDITTGKLLWEHKVTGQQATPTYVSSIAVGSEKVFVVSGYNQQFLYALSMTEGKELWKAALGPSTRYGFSSSPVATEHTVYVVSARGKLKAYEITTGNLTWEYDLKADVLSSPAISNGRLFVGTLGGELYAFE